MNQYYQKRIIAFIDILGFKTKVDDIDGLFYLLLDLVHLQLELASYDVLLRGGITIGDLYHDGSIVYGSAMNEAYLLESKKAKYPRIIADVHNKMIL